MEISVCDGFVGDPFVNMKQGRRAALCELIVEQEVGIAQIEACTG
jgi:hypothetical protein